MIIEESPLESARFGVAVGRAEIGLDQVVGPVDLAAGAAAFDVVIVRAPASRRDLGALLASVSTHVVIPADHLCYWGWSANRFSGDQPRDGLRLERCAEVDIIARLVRDSFEDYGNHYRANPLFDRHAALDGYCEWVERTLAGDALCLVLRSDEPDPLGFGLIDWSTDIPDIRLAAMARAAQGRGLYSSVLSGLMSATIGKGRDQLAISTQSDNINVMRAWAKLGLLPTQTLATHHLVRSSALGH